MASLENFRLVVFRAVAEQLSFRKAAEELYLTQPAVSLQIKALEEDLGVQLFDRSGAHITMTPFHTRSGWVLSPKRPSSCGAECDRVGHCGVELLFEEIDVMPMIGVRSQLNLKRVGGLAVSRLSVCGGQEP